MDVRRRSRVLGAILLVGLAPNLLAQETPAPASTPALSPEAMEAFLLKARVSNLRDAGRNTELNFKDTYRYNIAGYRVAKLIGLTTVPMSVERAIDGKVAAVTWWVDDVQMDEKERMKTKSQGPDPVKTNKQIQIMRIWDELIQNRDRNQGNILWTHDWTMWLIDHTRAFRLNTNLLKPEQLARCDRGLLERLRAVTPEALAQAVGNSLTKQEQEALLARRDKIIKHYDERIARLGEPVVLFTL